MESKMNFDLCFFFPFPKSLFACFPSFLLSYSALSVGLKSKKKKIKELGFEILVFYSID